MLSLAEQLLLLALHDEKGSVLFSASTALPYGLGGAVLLDLLFREKLRLSDNRIQVVESKPVGDAMLDETLNLIQESNKARSPKYWVSKIPGKVKDLQGKLTERLVQEAVLRREGRRVLWVFNVKRYPTADAVPEMQVRHRIRNIVLRDHPPGESELALISLVKACGLINEVFTKKERRTAKRKIKALTADEKVGKAVSAVVSEMTAAITAAVTAATVASTSSN